MQRLRLGSNCEKERSGFFWKWERDRVGRKEGGSNCSSAPDCEKRWLADCYSRRRPTPDAQRRNAKCFFVSPVSRIQSRTVCAKFTVFHVVFRSFVDEVRHGTFFFLCAHTQSYQRMSGRKRRAEYEHVSYNYYSNAAFCTYFVTLHRILFCNLTQWIVCTQRGIA